MGGRTALITAAAAVTATLLSGCGVPSGATPTPSVVASSMAGPPLAGDLAGGTPVQLGSASHWAIAAGRAYVATASGLVAIELRTGATLWEASFGQGEPWDAQPKLGLSADGSTVVAVRTVDSGGAARLDLLLVDADTGATSAEHLVTDPNRSWRVDLPPRVLTANGETVVLAADPESGRQSGVVRIADGALAWAVDDEAVAATEGTVVTRTAGRERDTGAERWRAERPLGPLLAQSPDALVVGRGGAGVWLDDASGAVGRSTARLGEAEPPCRPGLEVLVCVGADTTGYRLSDGERLWSSTGSAQSVEVVGDWVYLWRSDGRGDVLDARTGRTLVSDAALPAITYVDADGLLLATDDGTTWVPR